jgi:hypothetical protein
LDGRVHGAQPSSPAAWVRKDMMADPEALLDMAMTSYAK